MDFSKFKLGPILDKLESGEAMWDTFEPMARGLAPMLDGMFHLQPTNPTTVAALSGLPKKPGAPFSVMHTLDMIKAGEVKWDVLLPLLRRFATLIDDAVDVIHPGHPAVTAAIVATVPAAK